MTVDLVRVLETVTHVRGVRGAILADRTEGLVIAQSAMAGTKSDAVAALGAGLVQRCARLLAGGDLGGPRYLQVQASEGTLVAMPVDDDLVLLAVGDASVNVGLVRAELQRVAGAVR